jgi:calcium-translocating P-type ATPase
MLSRDINQKTFWSLSKDEVLTVLDSNEKGLASNEAEERKKIFGPNTIEEGKRITKFAIFFNQFKSPLIFLLLIAGVVTIFLGSYEDAGFIFAAALINAILGFYQENKAEGALAKLKTYVQERVRVFRGGREQEINVEELVPGDVVHLSQGSRVPADSRLLYVNDLSVDEAVLTGESLPTRKQVEPTEEDAGLGDRLSMVFKGGLVVEGFGNALVVATGSDTEIGKIAALLADSKSKEKTPLKRAISRFSVRMSLFLLAFTIILFFIGIWSGVSVFEMFLTSVAVMISAVPEGLPIAMTVILAIGVQRLAKRKGVVRKLLAAETLGDTSVILTDKTGTLTEAKISFSKISIFSDKKFTDESTEKLMFKLGVMNTDVIIENSETSPSEWRLVGNHMEGALVKSAAEHGVLLPQVKTETEVLDYLPFTSLKKYSAAVIRYRGQTYLSVLGAPEVLLEFSSVSESQKEEILKSVDAMAESGERLLALSVKRLATYKNVFLREGKIIHDLIFLGTISFRDPVREGVKDAIERINEAGVKTVIVTGDHKGTAEAVAKEVGFQIDEKNIINGSDLDQMSDKELESRLSNLQLVSRVSPEGKVRIAKAFKLRGEVVAMTGDGINDAASLKEADIGIAMGSGTDVAQDVSDLVLLDDNFKTIVSAIEEGRRIMQNIKKVITYLLSDALQEIILIGGSLLVGLAVPINALQILWVNFFSDSFPAISIAFENGEDYLKRKPRSFRGGLLDQQMKFLIFIVGTISSIIILLAYWYLVRSGVSLELAKTFTFATFGAGTLFILFSVKSLTRRIFTYNPFSNPYLLGSVLFGFLVMGIGIYVPFFQSLLGTVSLPPIWLLGVFGIGIFNIILIELAKWGFRGRESRIKS